MPRLTNQSYLLQCHQVRDYCRDESRTALFLLTPTDQWAIFAYFTPSQKLTDVQLISHREDISFLDPSLPQRAGRAFSKLKRADEQLRIYKEQPKPPKKKGAAYEIRLLSEVQPVLDPAKFALILQDYERRVDE